MAARFSGPDQTYTVRFVVYQSMPGNGSAYARREIELGEPLPETAVHDHRGHGAPRPEYLVLSPGAAAFRLRTCPDGLTITDLRIESAGMVSLLVRVEAGAGAPEWMPPAADYAIFHGHGREAPPAVHVRFRHETRAAGAVVSVDRLVTALGQSITRANARLASQRGEGGVALASSVTIRMAVDRFAVAGANRVLLRPGRNGDATGQHLEITLTTVPAETPDPES